MRNFVTKFYGKLKYRKLLKILEHPTEHHAASECDFYVVMIPSILTDSRLLSVATTNRYVYLRVGTHDTAEYYRIMMPRKLRNFTNKRHNKLATRWINVCKYFKITLDSPVWYL